MFEAEKSGFPLSFDKTADSTNHINIPEHP